MRPHVPARRQSHHRSNQARTLVVLGLAATLTVAGCQANPGDAASAARSDPAQTTASPSAGTSLSPTLGAPAGAWRMLPAAPANVRGVDSGVWTGTELILHAAPLSDRSGIEVAYNPTSNTWRKLASNPYPYLSAEAGEYAFWDGTEMLTFGNADAAYNPTTNRWRRLNHGRVTYGSVAAWTGQQVLMWGGGCCTSYPSGGAAYDPATDSWQPIPSAPLAGRNGAGVWTGRELVVVGGQNPIDNNTFADGAAYNPATRSWRKLPSLSAPRVHATVTWTGTEVLVVGGRPSSESSRPYADAMAWNPTTNRWRHLPDMPISRFNHMAVWTGSQLLVWGGLTATGRDGGTTPPYGVAYEPATNQWSVLAKSPLAGRTGAVATWTGVEMIIWGGAATRATETSGLFDGAAFRPAR